MPRTAQFEILTCLVDLCKILRTQLTTTLALIKQQEEQRAREASTPPAGEAENPEADASELYELGEGSLLKAALPYSSNQQAGSSQRERQGHSQARPGVVTEPHREVFGKVMWNLVASAELVFGIARE